MGRESQARICLRIDDLLRGNTVWYPPKLGFMPHSRIDEAVSKKTGAVQ